MGKLMKICISIMVAMSLIFMTGCQQVTDGDKETQQEIEKLATSWVDTNTKGDYEGVKALLGDKINQTYAPVSLYTKLVEQAPESKVCREGSLELAKYIMTRLYTESEVEKISVSQDKSQARVLMTWKSIDLDKVDTGNLNDTINDIAESQYQKRKDEYDANTMQNGDESTRIMLQDDSFKKVFEVITNLYKEAPDKDMRGILCYSYKTGEGYKLDKIMEYTELLYHTDGKYSWSYEEAMSTFEDAIANQGEDGTQS